MKAPVETRRKELREFLPRQLMQAAGHGNHPHELELVHNELETNDHDRLAVVWCTDALCKALSPRGTAVGPVRVCTVDRCTLCHPVTWWEKVSSTIRITLG